MDPLDPLVTADSPAASPEADAGALALTRVVRLAAWAFGAPFAQLIRFGPGAPISHGTLGTATPDLRALGTRLPPGAAVVVVEDAARDSRFVGALPADARFFAWASAEAGGEVLGALAVLDTEPHPPVPGEYLLELASVAADLLRGADAETRCAEAEARFQALGELVSDAVVVADPDGLVLDVNDRAAELLGSDAPDSLLGRPLVDLLDAAGGDGAPGVHADERPFPFEGRALRLAVLRTPGA